jgi:hypothetical protein
VSIPTAHGAVSGLVGIESGVVSGLPKPKRFGVGAPSGDHATESPTTKVALSHSGTETDAQFFEDWFDPIESGVRGRIRNLIESMIEAELEEALSRPRERPIKSVTERG